MKVFLIDFSTPMLRDVALTLKKNSLDILYWTGCKADFDKFSLDKDNFPDVIFHSTFDALTGEPAPGINMSKFDPPSADLLRELSECEPIALNMMNRFDYYNMSLDQKRNLYFKYIQYWRGVLTTLKPDAILFSDVPHAVYNYVLYIVAKNLNIRTLMYKRTALPDRLVFFEDYKKFPEIAEGLKKSENESIEFKNLSEDLQDYYNSQLDPKTDSTPIYRGRGHIKKRTEHVGRVLPSFRSIVDNLINFNFFKTSLSYLKVLLNRRKVLSLDEVYYPYYRLKLWQRKGNRKMKKLQEEYLRLSTSDVDLSKKFIYVPLHYQPESSTSPLGDFFVDQILMIRTLSAALPDDWFIYIKENFIQWEYVRGHLSRYPGYYEEMAKLKNVRLVPAEMSTYELIDRSVTVACVTGTAAWEAVLRLKPALIFGYVWFMYCEGIFRVTSPDECRQALRKIKEGYRPDKQSVIRFLSVVDERSVKAFPTKLFQKISSISYEDSVKNISQGFLIRLRDN